MNSVVVFGGSGFLGRAIVDQLVAAGMTARVAVRHPDAMKVPDATAAGGHVLSVHADVADEKSVGRALEGCDAAVNAVGLSSYPMTIGSNSKARLTATLLTLWKIQSWNRAVDAWYAQTGERPNLGHCARNKCPIADVGAGSHPHLSNKHKKHPGSALQTGFMEAGMRAGPTARVVLVVEDESLMRVCVAEEFRARGWHVLEAASGEHALTLTNNNNVDAVFTDIQLGRRNRRLADSRSSAGGVSVRACRLHLWERTRSVQARGRKLVLR